MKKDFLLYLLLILFGLSVLLGFFLVLGGRERSAKDIFGLSKKLPKVIVVDITGPIYFSEAGSNKWLSRDARYYAQKLKNISERKDINGIILRINSPGGSVGAVQEVYRQIVKIKNESKKPIVVYIPEICASGGYYIASAADKIVSAPGAIVGSIGVMLQLSNVEELFKKVGVSIVVFKSSKYKDIGSAYRKITDEEKKIFEDLINDAYEQFVEAISLGRNLPKDTVLQFANGSIFSAKKSKELNMIDEVGDEEKAIDVLKSIANIKGEVDVIKDTKPMDFFKNFFVDSFLKNKLIENVVDKHFRFEYIFE